MSSDSQVIPLAVPHLSGNEWAYVKECLDTNWVSYVGPYVDRFERELAAKVGAAHAVAVSSGTAALHIALLMAGVERDDEVIMPGLTFVAPANAVRYCDAWPVFTDVRAEDWQWDVERVAEFLDAGCVVRDGKVVHKTTGRRIAALLPVHLLGGMCDVDAVAELAARYELPLIEDAAECLGATYKGRGIGTSVPDFKGPLRLSVTSFNGNKIITTGGGGAIFTDDGDFSARARHLTTTAKADRIEFYHDEVGYNYRLTNIAAALGVAQLEKLDEYVKRKRTIAARYAEALAGLPVTPHPESAHSRSTFWMYSVTSQGTARPLIDQLNEQGIQARPLWQPLKRLPAFRDCPAGTELPVLNALYDKGLSLPCSVSLDTAAQERVISALAELQA